MSSASTSTATRITRDKVIRREFRLAEGDPFNSVRVKRSRDRIQSLGFFQENLEIEQDPGLGAGPGHPRRRRRGEGDRRAAAVGRLLEPRALPRQPVDPPAQLHGHGPGAARRGQLFELFEVGRARLHRALSVRPQHRARRRPLPARSISASTSSTTSATRPTSRSPPAARSAPACRSPNICSSALRYGLNYRRRSRSTRPSSSPIRTAPGRCPPACDPLLAGRYLCDAIGNRTDLVDRLFAGLQHAQQPPAPDPRPALRAQPGFRRPRRRRQISAHPRSTPPNIWNVGSGFIFSTGVEGGYIHSFEDAPAPASDPVRLTDRFFLGEPQIRGFDIRGVGPRVQRMPYSTRTAIRVHRPQRSIVDDALGGRAYYLGRAELEIPLGASVRELGLRPSVFVDVGALFGVQRSALLDIDPRAIRCTQGPLLRRRRQRRRLRPDARHCPTGTTLVPGITAVPRALPRRHAKPRVSVGFGVNWNSPFGPFRIDIAKALFKADGRRHQALHLQRRDRILMNKLAFGAALAALSLATAGRRPGAARARRRHRRRRHRPRSSASAPPARPPQTQLQAQVTAARSRAPAARPAAPDRRRSRSSRPRSRASHQTAPPAPTPSCAQHAHPGLPDRGSTTAQQELAAARAEHPVAPRQNVRQQISERLQPDHHPGDERRAAPTSRSTQRDAGPSPARRRHQRRARRAQRSSCPSRQRHAAAAGSQQPRQQPQPQGR